MSDQLKPVTHLSVDYFAAAGGIIGGSGPLARHTELTPAINIVIKTKLNTLFRIVFSFRVGSRLSARNDCKFLFQGLNCKIQSSWQQRGTGEGRVSRELASRSLSPIRPLPATCESHFPNPSSFRADSRRAEQPQFSGPWKPAQGKGQNAQGRESRYCENSIANKAVSRSLDDRI
jgi:hypothetical protein